jgi:hypothetical protein
MDLCTLIGVLAIAVFYEIAEPFVISRDWLRGRKELPTMS